MIFWDAQKDRWQLEIRFKTENFELFSIWVMSFRIFCLVLPKKELQYHLVGLIYEDCILLSLQSRR